MNDRVLDFSSFICEGLRFDPAGHYEKRVRERIDTLQISALDGTDEVASNIDLEDATKRCRYLLNKLATVSAKKLDLKSTAPTSFYSISLGRIKLQTQNGETFPVFDIGNRKGDVFYGVAHNQVLKTLILMPHNVNSDVLAAKGHDNLRRDTRRAHSESLEDYKKRHKVYTVFDNQSVHTIDMTMDYLAWQKEVDKMVGTAKPETDAAEFSAAALEDVTLQQPFRKEMVLSPGTRLTYLGKDGKKIDKVISNEEPPPVTTYKDGELTVFFEPTLVVVRGEERMIPGKKTFKKGDSFIVTPKNVTQSDLDQIKLATGEDSITLKDIEGAKFVGRIIEIGQYSKEKYKSQFPVSYVRIKGSKVLL